VATPRSVDRSINVAIVGVGNCASSLVQGLDYYRNLDRTAGLLHPSVFGYKISDIRIVAAFDVDERKVGFPLDKAIYADPNCTFAFQPALNHAGTTVLRGPTLDGWGRKYRSCSNESMATVVNVAEILRERDVDVVVSFLPVGSQLASEHYAEAALSAGAAFVNCIPVFLASNEKWARRFREAGVPIVGDDVKAQVGATIVHRVLARLFERRGATVEGTYQVNVGGNMDFLNMTEPERVQTKLESKVDAVSAELPGLPRSKLHAGPGGHIPWLEDRKVAFIRLKGSTFGGAPIDVEVRLDCWDSPNSAGVVVDAVRCAVAARKAGVGGPLIIPSAALMKRPPRQISDEVGLEMFDELVSLQSWPSDDCHQEGEC